MKKPKRKNFATWLAQLKYVLVRKYLVEEMVRDGWRQEPDKPGRLIHDNLRGDHTRVNMAEHEAISYHFKFRPLTYRPAPKPNVDVTGPQGIRGTDAPAPTEKP